MHRKYCVALSLFALAGFVLLLGPTASAGLIQPSPALEISPPSVNAVSGDLKSFAPTLDMDENGNAILVYQGKRGEADSVVRLYICRSADYGETWTEPARIFPEVDGLQYGEIPCLLRYDGTGEWLLFYRYGSTEGYATYLVRSTDTGVTWSTPVEVLDSTAARAIDTDGNGNWLVYAQANVIAPEGEDDWQDLALVRSTDNGVTWSEPEPILLASEEILSIRNPHPTTLDYVGNNSWLLSWFGSRYEDDEWISVTNVIRSTDNGLTWSAPFTDDLIYDEMFEPSAAVNTMFASDGQGTCFRGGRLLLHKSTDYGATWGPPTEPDRKMTAYFMYQTPPDMVMRPLGGGAWIALWGASIGGNLSTEYEIQYSISIDDGLSWSDALPFNSTYVSDLWDYADRVPQLATDGNGNWVVAWISIRWFDSAKVYVSRFEWSGAECDVEGEGEAPIDPVLLTTLADISLAGFERSDTLVVDGQLDLLQAEYYMIPTFLEGDGCVEYSDVFAVFDGNGDGGITPAEFQLWSSGSAIHTADTNADEEFTLSELLRVVQLYNAGAYSCAALPSDTEDGYLPGSEGGTACPRHTSDYAAAAWVINLSELLRTIQFYNLGGIEACVEGESSEDGFCMVE